MGDGLREHETPGSRRIIYILQWEELPLKIAYGNGQFWAIKFTHVHVQI